MIKRFSFLRNPLHAFHQQLLVVYGNDEEELNKVRLMYGISLIGIFFLSLLGLIAYLQDNLLLAALDFLVAGTLAGILALLSWSKRYLHACVQAGVAVMFALYLYLFVSGGVAGHAFVWSYTFPLFTFFLLGARKGFFVSCLYFLCCATLMVLDVRTSFLNLYSLNLTLRFLPSFAVVLLFSLVYEKFRASGQKALINAKNNLERQVAERTAELSQQVRARDKTQAQLMRAKEEWERTFDAVPDLLVILDRERRVVRSNNALVEQLKTSVEGLIERNCARFAGTHTPRNAVVFDEHLQRYLSISVSPLVDEYDALAGSVYAFRDITEAKQAERELEKYAETQAVLLREVNHRVKNNLKWLYTKLSKMIIF